jgi:hypothetical protein
VNTHELFDFLCEQFNPRLKSVKLRVLMETPAQLFTSEEERAMSVILTQTLRDLAERPKTHLLRESRVARGAGTDLDSFLGITGKL